MPMPKPSIGIFGGAFNPIHLGHLAAAQEALLRYRLDRVFFVPAGISVWEKPDWLNAESRFRLVALALNDNPRFFASRIEIERPNRSYSVDTLRAFHHRFPQSPLFLLIGSDAFSEFPRWKEPQEILKLAELIVICRPGTRLTAAIRNRVTPRVHLLHYPGVAISSKEIRARLARRESIRYLVPDPVYEAILQETLYQEEVSK